jgi:hypothetical protein
LAEGAEKMKVAEYMQTLGNNVDNFATDDIEKAFRAGMLHAAEIAHNWRDEAHWDYVQRVLILHGEEPDNIAMIGFHYQSAFIHGVKHGVEGVSE